MDWRWSPGTKGFRDYAVEFTIHNDVGNWSRRHGYYLILMQNRISDTGFYFGLQTDVQDQGKGVVFSRWGTRDLANARYSRTDGWTDSSGHEGDFIGVRRSYEWGAGDYRLRMAPDGLESDGEWFGLWITDLGTGETTWVGSLKFPLLDGTAMMQPRASATIEVYGHRTDPACGHPTMACQREEAVRRQRVCRLGECEIPVRRLGERAVQLQRPVRRFGRQGAPRSWAAQRNASLLPETSPSRPSPTASRYRYQRLSRHRRLCQ